MRGDLRLIQGHGGACACVALALPDPRSVRAEMPLGMVVRPSPKGTLDP